MVQSTPVFRVADDPVLSAYVCGYTEEPLPAVGGFPLLFSSGRQFALLCAVVYICDVCVLCLLFRRCAGILEIVVEWIGASQDNCLRDNQLACLCDSRLSFDQAWYRRTREL